jgi:hypothetical protein
MLSTKLMGATVSGAPSLDGWYVYDATNENYDYWATSAYTQNPVSAYHSTWLFRRQSYGQVYYTVRESDGVVMSAKNHYDSQQYSYMWSVGTYYSSLIGYTIGNPTSRSREYMYISDYNGAYIYKYSPASYIDDAYQYYPLSSTHSNSNNSYWIMRGCTTSSYNTGRILFRPYSRYISTQTNLPTLQEAHGGGYCRIGDVFYQQTMGRTFYAVTRGANSYLSTFNCYYNSDDWISSGTQPNPTQLVGAYSYPIPRIYAHYEGSTASVYVCSSQHYSKRVNITKYSGTFATATTKSADYCKRIQWTEDWDWISTYPPIHGVQVDDNGNGIMVFPVLNGTYNKRGYAVIGFSSVDGSPAFGYVISVRATNYDLGTDLGAMNVSGTDRYKSIPRQGVSADKEFYYLNVVKRFSSNYQPFLAKLPLSNALDSGTYNNTVVIDSLTVSSGGNESTSTPTAVTNKYTGTSAMPSYAYDTNSVNYTQTAYYNSDLPGA